MSGASDSAPDRATEGRRYRAVVAYDGTDYVGFQRQRPGPPTIQGRLEEALTALGDAPVTVIAAGRTDSGVHASGQVIAFNIVWRHELAALQRALNANLPRDIAVSEVDETAAGFHPRFDARRRTYEYRINNAATRNPLWERYSWHVDRPLDIEAMNAAAGTLIGRHDFATFGWPPQGDNSVREVFDACWRRDGAFVLFSITANAFLYRMVRRLVGTLAAVGAGRMSGPDFTAALAARDRREARVTAPPQGLTLTAVIYD